MLTLTQVCSSVRELPFSRAKLSCEPSGGVNTRRLFNGIVNSDWIQRSQVCRRNSSNELDTGIDLPLMKRSIANFIC